MNKKTKLNIGKLIIVLLLLSLSVLTVISWIFIIAGIAGLLYLICFIIKNFNQKDDEQKKNNNEEKNFSGGELTSQQADLIENLLRVNREGKKGESQNKKYHSKPLLTEIEKTFFNIISKNFSDKYIVQAQIPLSQIVRKDKSFSNEYANELYRQIDICIFDHNWNTKLAIEINDKSHFYTDRRNRDIKVQNILNESNIPLLTFWTQYNNREDFIVRKINENLNVNNTDKEIKAK